MKIEAIAFYLLKCSVDKSKIKGSLHIRLPDYGIDLRGCLVNMDGTSFFVAIPHLKAPDDTNTMRRFPMIVFLDKALQDDLKASLIPFAKDYVLSLAPTLAPKSHQVMKPRVFKKAFKKPYKPRSDSKPYPKTDYPKSAS